jgi:PadR family transcriptional regulator, regulatory protein PadR
MTRRPSPQALSVLTALAAEPNGWRYGYELGQEVALKAGTLYPILMRLCDQGLLEASWEDDPPIGRPRRHLYRILADGVRAAAAAERAPVSKPRPVTARRAEATS